MTADRQFAFASFRFDARTGRLWRDSSEVRLTPRAAAVLHLLADRAQDLVTKQELFDRVWGGMAVGDDALTSCVQELRGALGDDARRPQLIETRHRRGYRLMVPARPIAVQNGAAAPPQAFALQPPHLVGRVAELEELARAFDRSRSGRRQLVFVSGEPGIGKSSLADAFVERIQTGIAVRIAYGQCLDHHGVGEAYLPLIEALTRLAGGRDGAAVKNVLSARAPSWLAQMPSFWSRAERAALERRGLTTRERMMRELTLAIEAIASDVPLVLKLEDIHWSDVSTLDWLAHMARRPEPARLMVLATFRSNAPSEGLGDVVAELALHEQCSEIVLNPLTLDAVEAYLKLRLGDDGGDAQVRKMAPLLLERTGGNPLFMTSIVSRLAHLDAPARTPGAIVSIPQDVRRFIERQLHELDENDRNLLAAASVIGRRFATAALAAVLETDIERIESDCARLARQGVFIAESEATAWPDGTRAELYAFRHDLYRELLHDRLPAARRALAHARAGRRLEVAWAGRLDVVASELAEHFERGNEPARAITHHQRAAAKALRRSANQEAIGHLRRALDAIGSVVDETERTRIEVELLIGLGAAFMATRGFGAPEVLDAYSRAEALCEQLGDRADIFPAIWGQWLFRWGRSEMTDARRLSQRLLALAEKSGDAGLKLQAHHAAWATSFGWGELAQVRAHAQAGLALYDAKIHQSMASSYGNHDARACALYFTALSSALAGDEERARTTADKAIAVARGLDDPFSLALALFFASAVAQILGDVTLASHHAGASRQIASEHDLAMVRAWSTGVAGWCAAENGESDRGIAWLSEAIAQLRATQSHHFLSYLLGLLADAHLKAGHCSLAMQAVEDGLAPKDGERYYTAELHRLRGELLARRSPGDAAEAQASFCVAVELAKQQGAAALEQKARATVRRWSR
jgi:DNA-binding winged helix-turn-helix (wHTH) protein/predicted ATPase